MVDPSPRYIEQLVKKLPNAQRQVVAEFRNSVFSISKDGQLLINAVRPPFPPSSSSSSSCSLGGPALTDDLERNAGVH